MSSRSSDIKHDETILRWHGYRYFPYEKVLAEREVESVLGVQPESSPSGLTVPSDSVSVDKIERLTYFRDAVGRNSAPIETIQGMLERTCTGDSAHVESHKKPKRQATRYSAHGLHEYKGKFNPQIVRAIGNILSLERGAWLLDPFCGSGTTLLEAFHGGWNAVGTDLNPLAVEIANAKVAAIQTPMRRLAAAAATLEGQVSIAEKLLSHNRHVSEKTIAARLRPDWTSALANFDYLSRWFPRPVLAQLAILLDAIAGIRSERIRRVFRIVLSDILRGVSLQEPADLRIRRRKDAAPNYPAITIFLADLKRKLDMIERAQWAIAPCSFQLAVRHDIRAPLPQIDGASSNEFDAAITSPPYATALPYIDTQRLSLCLLGLVDWIDLGHTEHSLIGTREISSRQRRELGTEIESNEARLPPRVHEIAQRMLHASLKDGNGFRRQNTPGLIYKYFGEMQDVFRALLRALKPKSKFALLVGRNRTRLGGKDFVVETPHLLAEIAQQAGWELADVIDLEAYQRYDIHHQNSIRKEGLIILRRPSG